MKRVQTVKLGQKVTHIVMMAPGSPPKMTGTVVYIHPDNRFYTVEFETLKGKIRESYFMEQPE